MLNNITIGQFFPGNSLLHRMDPRAKIIGTTIFVVAIFLANTPLAYGIVAAFTIGAMLLSRLPSLYSQWGFIFLQLLVIASSPMASLILRIMDLLWACKWRHD